MCLEVRANKQASGDPYILGQMNYGGHMYSCMYVGIWLHNCTIYISAGPSLEGPPGCEEYVSNCISTVFCYPFCNYLFFLSTSVKLPVCSLPVWYLIEGYSKLETGVFDFGVFLRPWSAKLPSPGCVISAWVLPRNPSKIITFQTYLQDL
jgi:hypothetical protein